MGMMAAVEKIQIRPGVTSWKLSRKQRDEKLAALFSTQFGMVALSILLVKSSLFRLVSAFILCASCTLACWLSTFCLTVVRDAKCQLRGGKLEVCGDAPFDGHLRNRWHFPIVDCHYMWIECLSVLLCVLSERSLELPYTVRVVKPTETHPLTEENVIVNRAITVPQLDVISQEEHLKRSLDAWEKGPEAKIEDDSPTDKLGFCCSHNKPVSPL